MGFMQTLFGGSETEADTLTRIGGIFNDPDNPEGAEIARFLKTQGENRFNDTPDPFNLPDSTPDFDFNNFIKQSQFGGDFSDAVKNPTFKPRSSAEEALIKDIESRFFGNTALRNLKATGGGHASAIAPTLVDLNQKHTQNLFDAFKSELSGTLQGQDLNQAERGGDINASLNARNQDLGFDTSTFEQGTNTLLALANLSRPDNIVQGGSSNLSGGIIPALSGFVSATNQRPNRG